VMPMHVVSVLLLIIHHLLLVMQYPPELVEIHVNLNVLHIPFYLH